MSSLRSLLAFVGLAVLWGLTVTAMEVGLQAIQPLRLSAVRYGLAGGLLIGYVVVTERNWLPRSRGDLLAIGGGGIFWIAIGNGIWFVGQGLTTSVLSGLMTSLIPITTTAVSWVVIPEDRLTPASLAGLLVSFAGAVLLFWPSGTTAFDTELFGKSLLLVGVLGTAIGSVLIRRARAELSRAAQTAWSVLLGAGLIYALSLAAGETGPLTVDSVALGAIAYLVVAGTVVAYLLFFSLFERHSAIEVSLLTYLIPVVAATAGWLAFGEPITPQLVVGFLVIVTGFALMKRRALVAEFGPRWA